MEVGRGFLLGAKGLCAGQVRNQMHFMLISHFDYLVITHDPQEVK